MHTIGSIIKKYRTQANISQRELARRINMTGQMISKIEKNETNPSDQTILSIAKELNIPNDTIQKYINLNSPLARMLFNSFKECGVDIAKAIRKTTIDEIYSNTPIFKTLDEYKNNILKYWEDVIVWYPLDEINNLNLNKLSDKEIEEIAKALEFTFNLKIAELKSKQQEKPTE